MRTRIDRVSYRSILLLIFTLLQCTYAAEVEPLLTTRWGQRGPYAFYTPKNERLGCWSAAIAQILYYHRMQPSGTVEYAGQGYSISEDLNYEFHWDLFSDCLTSSTSQDSRSEVARYCYYTAIAIRKDFAPNKSYKGNSDVRRKGLAECFGCATRRYSTGHQGIETVKKAIINYLSKKYPLMLYIEGKSGIGHAFVIDGVRTENGKYEVHLNCGWNGKDNGWYEFERPIKTSYGLFDDPGRWVMILRPGKIT